MKLRQVDPEPIFIDYVGIDKLTSSKRSESSIASSDRSPNHSDRGYALVSNEVEFIPDSKGKIVNIYIDGNAEYYSERVPRRYHCWFSKTSEGVVTARFRASQVLSWLEIVDKHGKPHKIHQRFGSSNSVLEWRRSRGVALSTNVDAIRWDHKESKMSAIYDGIVQFPASVKLVPSARPMETVWNRGQMSARACAISPDAAANPSAFKLQWRQPAVRNTEFEQIILCTATITHWKWTRDSHITERSANNIHDPFVSWLARNSEIGPNMNVVNRSLLSNPTLKCSQSAEYRYV